MWRARKPRSWWVTNEYRALVGVHHGIELLLWQNADPKKRGSAPKPPKIPEDREVTVKSQGELQSKRNDAAEHLRRRREQLERERR